MNKLYKLLYDTVGKRYQATSLVAKVPWFHGEDISRGGGGGGGNLTCPSYGVVPFSIIYRVRIFYRYGFFGKSSFIGELSWRYRIYGYTFLKIFRSYGYTFKKFLRI